MSSSLLLNGGYLDFSRSRRLWYIAIVIDSVVIGILCREGATKSENDDAGCKNAYIKERPSKRVNRKISQQHSKQIDSNSFISII